MSLKGVSPASVFSPHLTPLLQIITTLLLNWTRGMPQITLRCGTKTPADYFGKENGENEVLIHKVRGPELLSDPEDAASGVAFRWGWWSS